MCSTADQSSDYITLQMPDFRNAWKAELEQADCKLRHFFLPDGDAAPSLHAMPSPFVVTLTCVMQPQRKIEGKLQPAIWGESLASYSQE